LDVPLQVVIRLGLFVFKRKDLNSNSILNQVTKAKVL
jgi:hypothetical protein